MAKTDTQSNANQNPSPTGSTPAPVVTVPAASTPIMEAAVKAHGPMKAYYGGLTAECPLDYITVPTIAKEGAPTLSKYTQKLQDDGKGVYSLSGKQPGGVLHLFDDEYEAMVNYVKTHLIYWESKGTDKDASKRVSIIPEKGDGSHRSRRDDVAGRVEPLAKYVYLVKASGVSLQDQDAGLRFPTLDKA